MNNQDISQQPLNLDKYKRKIQPEQQQVPEQENEISREKLNQVGSFEDLEQKSFEKDKYKRKYEPGDERHITRSASRIAETIVGFPGNVINTAKFLGNLLPEPPSFLKKSETFTQKYGKKALEMIPTSDDLKKSSQDYFGLWTTPLNEKEKVSDEVVETFTNLMIPLGQQQTWLRSISAAAGGVFAKVLSKEYGAPEWLQESIKFGTTIGISVFNPGGAKEYSSNLYKLADQAIPDTVSVPGKNLLGSLGNLRTNLAKGGGEMEKNSALVIKWVDKISDHINQNAGRLNIKEGQAFAKNINSVMGDWETLERAKKLFPVIQKEVRNTMQQVESTFPEYWKLYKNADEAFGAVAQGSQISKRVEDAVKKSPLKSELGILMSSAAYDPRLTAGYVAGRALMEATDILSQYARSKVLRGYYNKMLMQGLNNNKTALLSTVKKIDKQAQKEEKKSKTSR